MDLYARHVNGVIDDQLAVSDTKPKVSDEELEKEFGRQRGYLEKSLESLKKKSQKEAAVHASDRSKLLRENSILTTEINTLRCVHWL